MGKVTVSLDDLEFALMWVSGGDGFGSRAVFRRSDGKMFCDGAAAEPDVQEPMPDDADDGALYAEVPDSRSLDLGNALAFAFVEQSAPRLAAQVHAVFGRRGAWRAFRDLLDRNGLDDAWHAFKDRETRQALVRWARDEGFEVPGQPAEAVASDDTGDEDGDTPRPASPSVVDPKRGGAAPPDAAPRPQPVPAVAGSGAGLFIYAKDLERLAAFYAAVVGLARVHVAGDLVVLRGQGIDLLVHAIPPHIAAGIAIESPPVRREDTALKFFFTVPSLAEAARTAARLGGQVLDDEWRGPGFRVRNAIDLEGNVFQLREAIR